MLPVRALLVDFDGTACPQDVSEMLRGSGVLYSDVVFAKDALVQICEQDGVPFLPWDRFDDARNALDTLGSLRWAAEPDPCPGWTTP